MAVKDVVLVDDNDIPALNLTAEEVEKVKNSKALDLTAVQVNNCKKIKALGTVSTDSSSGAFTPNNPGLYSILVQDKITRCTHSVVMSIPNLTGTDYYSTQLNNSSNGNYTVTYKIVNSDTGRYGFMISNTSAGEILDVKTIMEYVV